MLMFTNVHNQNYDKRKMLKPVIIFKKTYSGTTISIGSNSLEVSFYFGIHTPSLKQKTYKLNFAQEC